VNLFWGWLWLSEQHDHRNGDGNHAPQSGSKGATLGVPLPEEYRAHDKAKYGNDEHDRGIPPGSQDQQYGHRYGGQSVRQ